AVVAVVDLWGERLANELKTSQHQELVVVKPNMVENPVLDVEASTFEWRGLKIRTPLLGLFNMFNLVVVGETLKGFGIDDEVVAGGLETVKPVKGRMEPVAVPGSDLAVIVDYSHKPEALAQALNAVRSFSAGRVWLVFGAGGNRDSAKRPLMGQIASELADEIIVTSDNPRSEEPSEIAAEIVSGIKIETAKSKVLLDRADAIHFAVNRAQSGDSILIAGKGHETYQEIGNEQRPFDDVKVAKEALLERVRTSL
ncbi:MAG TPA: UDP-N-acetylmuramoyl-L-alanyl-D-glutamate--2,6-diaminopimelate ligase, partial [Acidimicrobiaceae bacterium]|nr:UDP-N-acetylmuramoyl-L-alanyl-D-glutamate--2,6-diaminopimelate ligase [Acidimicrobiaceae bacterium]